MSELVHIHPSKLIPSPTQPRSSLGPLDELVESIRVHGVLEPILARRPAKPKNGELEVVAGGRRHAAALKAGVDTVEVIVRELTDNEVLEQQLIENNERRDLPPLDEARHYERMLKAGYDYGSIAAKIARTPSYVARRMNLLKLAPKCRKELDDGKLPLGIAELLARIPDVKLQEEAFGAVGDQRFGEPLTVSEARKEIEEKFMLRLEKAPFDTSDAELVPDAGACTSCKKRTGNQRVLFDDVKSPDLCVDPPCFRSKLDALWKIRRKDATAKGQEVLAAKDYDVAGADYGSSKYVRTTDRVYVDGKTLGVKSLVSDAPTVLAQDPETRLPVHLVARADLKKAIEQKKRAGKPRAGSSRDPAQAAMDRKAKIRKLAIAKVLDAAVTKGKTVEREVVLEYVVRAFAARVWSEVQKSLAKRRGLEGKDAERALVALATELPADELQGLGLELALLSAAPGNWNKGSVIWADGLKLLKLDWKKLEQEAAAELKSAKAQKKHAKRHGKTEPKANDDGETMCRGCGCTDSDPCDGGCEWVEADLCSKCAGGQPKGKKAKKPTKGKAAGASKAEALCKECGWPAAETGHDSGCSEGVSVKPTAKRKGAKK